MSNNWLKAKFKEGKAALSAEVGKIKNKKFMEAVIAGCALVAAASGGVSGEEKKKMLAFIRQSEELKCFHTEDVITFFNKRIEAIEFDADYGRAESMRYIDKLRGNSELSRLLVRVCISIANSDGNFDQDEIKAVIDICNDLQLNPSDFGLLL